MQQTMVGQVYHHPKGQKKFLSKYSPKLPFLIPVVTIDGLFISFDKTKIKHKFDETIGKFHFYDHGFAVPNYLDDVKIGVTSSFEITHESVGKPNDEFWVSKELFVKKWGSKLPLDLKPSFAYSPEIKIKNFKKFGKVAIIIPTKGKVEMLKDCVDSFFTHCDKDRFNIFNIASGKRIKIKNLAHAIKKILKSNKSVIFKKKVRSFDVKSWRADIKKLSELNIKIKFSIKKGLIKTLRYYEKTNNRRRFVWLCS
jgi:hypothetical protein